MRQKLSTLHRRCALRFTLASLAAVLGTTLVPSIAVCQSAPGAPGSIPTWTAASKDGLGTSTTTDSTVWFTLQGGVLTEVYYPRLDNADVRTLEFAVSDGKRVWLESTDMEHSIERVHDDSLEYRQSSRDAAGTFKIAKTYATDPHRDTLLIDVTFTADPKYSLYVLFDPALNNTGAGDTGYSSDGALVAVKNGTAVALASSTGLKNTSSGFAGSSDGYTDLLLHHELAWRYERADNGNVVQAAKVDGGHFTLALGFGHSPNDAVDAAKASLERGFAATSDEYNRGWSAYAQTLRKARPPYENEFQLAAMVLKAHEDKTYRGAMIASMSIPWGFALSSQKPDVGGYHLIWARDLYEVATAMMAAGDRAAAERALDYLFNVQQKSDGSFPQNSWLDGRPYWTKLQMDEVAYPLVLAWQLGRMDAATWQKHVRPAAEFIVSRGPATEEERWEEVSGYSPSTIAAEIAGLVCASEIAKHNRANDDAARYLSKADEWASNLEKMLVTHKGHLGGPLAAQGYYFRIGDSLNPDDGFQLDVRNGGGVHDQADVVDAGFLELVRLGIRPANDPAIERSVEVVDQNIRIQTPNGPSFRRYSSDGYGETFFGGPWLGQGVGRLWPIFTGERGEYEVARGRDASVYLNAMLHFANDGGMIPEQVWDRAEPTTSRFVFGEGTGSATPLAWSMAQFIRLVVCVEDNRVVEQPSVVATHFLKNGR